MINPTGKPFTVTEITRRIKDALEGTFGLVEVTGDVTNFRGASSGGHLYFSLADSDSRHVVQAQIPVTVFAGVARGLTFQLAQGKKITVTGNLEVYAPQGKYQIIARKVAPAGEGDLMARYLEIKRNLDAEGLFAPERKRPLPLLPRHIGVVTAQTGAAIRDIVNTFTRRFPNLDILIAPVRVQGTGAAAEIARGVQALNLVGVPGGGFLEDLPPRDVILVCRGGGSFEDLWEFNEESVARAIFASRAPVISGVGHEIDTSICDLVADVRAATPTAAAEIAIRPKADFEATLRLQSEKMASALSRRVADFRGRLNAAAKNRVFAEPAHAVNAYRQDLDHLMTRRDAALAAATAAAHGRLSKAAAALSVQQARRIPELRARLADFSTRAAAVLERRLADRRARVGSLSRALAALSPLAVLDRGYSITLLDDGHALRDPAEAPAATLFPTVVTFTSETFVVTFPSYTVSSAPRAVPSSAGVPAPRTNFTVHATSTFLTTMSSSSMNFSSSLFFILNL